MRRSGGGIVVYRWGADDAPEVLLLRKRRSQTWDLPKGKLEPGEGALEGALRETLEETGLVPEVRADFHDCASIEKPASPRREAYTLEVTFFSGEVPRGAQVTLSEEHDSFRWATPSEASRGVDPPVLGEIVASALACLAGEAGEGE